MNNRDSLQKVIESFSMQSQWMNCEEVDATSEFIASIINCELSRDEFVNLVRLFGQLMYRKRELTLNGFYQEVL